MKSSKTKLTTFSIIFLAAFSLFGQPGNSYINNIMVPSPQVASLGRYIEVPVSYYTGVPNVSIPIYTLSEGTLNLPVSLSYHAGGVQVSDVASWAGLGWSIQAGGMVSRMVQDKMDEDGTKGWYYHGDEIPSESNACAFYQHYSSGIYDSEPDIFSFSFPGGSGKFYFSNDANPVPVLVPLQDIKIVPYFGGTPFNLKGFDIVTSDGTIYQFGDIGDGSPAYEITASNNGNYPDIPSSWFLKKIISYDGKFSINLSYTDEYFMQKYAPTRNTAYQLPEFLSSHVKSKRLSSITTSLETITFVPSDTSREDLDPHPLYPNDSAKKPKRLKSITITSGNFGKRIDFVHDYWLDNSAWASTQGTLTENKRLRLLRIVEKSLDGTTFVNPPQSFEYFSKSGNPNFLPKTFSRAVDHWGFYNGVDQNNASFPAPNMPYYDNICYHGGTCVNINLIGGGGGNSDRASYETPMKYGTLKKVNYPNGGFTEFDMEANERYVGSSYTTDIALVTCNHGYPNGGPCAGITTVGTPNPVSFTATDLPNVKYKLGLRLVTNNGCNCITPDSPPVQVSMLVKVYNSSNTLVFESGQYQINCNDTTGIFLNGNLQTFCNNQLQANTPYRFEVFVNKASAIFMAYKTGTVTVGNEEVGGLRVKQVRTNDGISISNDIIRNYEYLDSIFTTRSSGVLYNLPKYDYAWTMYPCPTSNCGSQCDPCQSPPTSHPGGCGNVFIDTGIVPLSSFEGYHIGYTVVKEISPGNGYKRFTYQTEPPTGPPSPVTFPYGPALARVVAGNLRTFKIVNETGTTIQAEYHTPVSDPYIVSSGTMYKKFNNAGSYLVNTYSIRTRKLYRDIRVTNTLDGVSTTTNYEYYAQVPIDSPKAIEVTNSDGKVTRTEYRYPSTLAFQCLRDDFANRNIKSIPTSVRTLVDGVLVNADSTRWSNWSPTTGLPNQTCNATNLPYPWEFYNYEMTYDASGNPTAGTWVKKGVINERSTTAGSVGLPQKFTQTGWQPEKYEWAAGGLITKRTYNPDDATPYKRFVTQYDYYPGTRLISKITNIDGQYMEYDYDKLMRTSVVKGRKTGTSTYNVQTTYTYQYKNATNPRSYVKTATTYTDMTASGSAFKEKTVWQYLDGLGRPVQTVDMKHSPAQKDVAVTTEYDNQGRVSKVYNPFESTLTTGAFVATVPSGTPYTLSEYYSDPLNRTWKVTPPSWYPTIYAYGTNVASNVKLNHTTNTYYGANLLFRTTVTDPNGNKSITFKDKKGRLILSRRTDNAETASLNADTYNLYDNKDRLTTVIPPDATISNTNLLFKYLYDQADNMTMKDVPDAAPMTMMYNTRNLMTLMQDGNINAATPTKYLATNYDIYGRPTSTGFYTSTTPNPNATFSFSTANNLTTTTYDDLTGLQDIYKGKVKQSQVKIMDTANNTFITTDYTYDAYGRVSGTSANNFTGGSDNYTFSYDWADNRLTSTRTHKRLSTDAATTILETTIYDHAGRAYRNKHRLNSDPEQTLNQLAYNYEDELVQKKLGLSTCDIGSESFTGGGSAVPTACWLQSLDYSYNDQGWLTAINQGPLGGGSVPLAACPTAPTAPAPTITGDNDLFYLELKYDNLFSSTNGNITGMTGTVQKNGNIAQLAWRTRGRERQSYRFSYDFLDRLTAANYYDVVEATNTATASSRYNETLTYADKRGNIASLTRSGGQVSGSCWNYSTIDNLTYTYTSGTNKISSITDAASATYKGKGFNPGAGTGSYAYDSNGNMTTDPYKSMTVQYNHLNLPKMFTFTGGAQSNTIEVLYDAAGTKLRKIVKTGTTTNYTQDYLGGIEYRDGAREAIYTAEGRVFYNSGTPRYEYSIKDHLGNTRLTFTDKDNNGVVDVTANPATNEILQENHYYPFGLNTEGPWISDASLDNRYQYNGKELNDDFGLNLNDYGARWYDASVGRFNSLDPASQDNFQYSTYSYVENNPIKFVDYLGLDNIIYVYFAESVSQKERKGIIKETNRNLKKLGLNTKATAIDYIPSSTDLKKSDTFAFVGTDDEINNFMKSDEAKGYDTFDPDAVSRDGSFEISGNPEEDPQKGKTEKDKGNAIYVETTDTKRELNDPYRNQNVKSISYENFSGWLISHGSGHNAGLMHSKKNEKNSFMSSADRVFNSNSAKKDIINSTQEQREIYHKRFSDEKPKVTLPKSK